MKNNPSFQISYFLVTRGFTLSMLWLLIVLIDVFDGDSGTRVSSNDIEITMRDELSTRKMNRIVEVYGPEEHYEDTIEYEDGQRSFHSGIRRRTDTIREFKRKFADGRSFPAYLPNPKISLPLAYFRKSHTIHYYFLQTRAVLNVLLWILMLFQLYLILDDLRKEQFFIEANAKRLRRIGYFFLIQAALSFLTFHYFAGITPNGTFYVMEDWHLTWFGNNSMFFLMIGVLILVLSWVFKAGFELTEENKLTI